MISFVLRLIECYLHRKWFHRHWCYWLHYQKKIIGDERIRKETINERISVSSNVVSFVINDDIEPAAGVHKLLSCVGFSGSLMTLRSIKDAVGSWRQKGRKRRFLACLFLCWSKGNLYLKWRLSSGNVRWQFSIA